MEEEIREEIVSEEKSEENRFEGDSNSELNRKLRQYFDGKIVRKDLTKNIKEGANVPVYVLEYLLGQYCNSEDEKIISEGVDNVKRILANNYVRPDEAQKVLSALRERGAYTVIDKITRMLPLVENNLNICELGPRSTGKSHLYKEISPNLPREKRIKQYLRQIENPYLVRVGNIKVKIRFANEGTSIEDAFEQMLLNA